MTVAVIGAGWAGLAAAVTLHQKGVATHVFEAAPRPGGRARTVDWPASAHAPDNRLITDNGQHILLGAYTATLDLMRALGRDPDTCFLGYPLSLEHAQGSFALNALPLPAPLHLLAGLLRARGLNGRERLALLRQLSSVRAIANGRPLPAGLETVQAWLVHGHQPETLIQGFWAPLCVAAMNTAAHEACTRLFSRVLADSLTGPASASRILIPRRPLGELWCDTAIKALSQENGASRFYPGTPVRGLTRQADGTFCIHTTRHATDTAPAKTSGYSAVIVATPPRQALRLLANLPDPPPAANAAAEQAETARSPGALRRCLEHFEYRPIATLTLLLDQPWNDPAPMLMLHEDHAAGFRGQWVFNHRHYDGQSRLSVVISDATHTSHLDGEALARAVIAQLQAQTSARAPLPRIVAHKLIIEKRATFAAVPGLVRPANITPWPGILVAGDWTDTGYPAVLEGAVRSGLAAARHVLDHRTQPLGTP